MHTPPSTPAQSLLLDEKCSKHPSVRKAVKMAGWLERCARGLKAELTRMQRQLPRAGGELWTRAWAAYIR